MKKYREALLEWQRDYIRKALEANGNSVVRVARATGLNRQHLYRFCQKIGIDLNKRPMTGGNAAWKSLGGF